MRHADRQEQDKAGHEPTRKRSRRGTSDSGAYQQHCGAAEGRDLSLIFIALTHWSEAHVLGELGPIEIVDEQTGRGSKVALIDADGRVVPSERAVPKVRDRGP